MKPEELADLRRRDAGLPPSDTASADISRNELQRLLDYVDALIAQVEAVA